MASVANTVCPRRTHAVPGKSIWPQRKPRSDTKSGRLYYVVLQQRVRLRCWQDEDTMVFRCAVITSLFRFHCEGHADTAFSLCTDTLPVWVAYAR